MFTIGELIKVVKFGDSINYKKIQSSDSLLQILQFSNRIMEKISYLSKVMLIIEIHVLIQRSMQVSNYLIYSKNYEKSSEIIVRDC